MFGAIGRYFSTVFYYFTGRTDQAREAWLKKPEVIKATYDRIAQEKVGNINEHKNAIAAMIVQEETKKEKLKTVSNSIAELEKLRSGALAKAKMIAAKHDNDPEAVKTDTDYIRCQAAYRDFTSTLEEKQKLVEELEEDLERLGQQVSTHKATIESKMRELEKIKEEKHEAVAEIMSSEEDRKLADMMNGLSEDRNEKELTELREIRKKARANSVMSRELAGLDAKRAENEFLAYATQTQSDDEFDRLIGLTKKETVAEETPAETKISES